MNANECAALAREMMDRFNAHDADAIEGYYADDCERIDVAGERYLGPVDARRSVEAWLDAFSDASFEVKDVVGGENCAIAELTFRGTHDAPLAIPGGSEIPATGKHVEGNACLVFRFEN